MNQLTVSLWGDEAFSAILAQKDFFGIISTTARDTAPPLYYLLLHVWIGVFGTSEIALRSLSLSLYVLTAGVIYFFARELFGKKAAFFGGLLFLLNPVIFTYAFEARMYLLLVITSTLSMWFFMTKRRFLYIIATVLALYTHHFSLFLVMTQVVSYLFSEFLPFITSKKWSLSSLMNHIKTSSLGAFVIVFLCYVPWLPVMIEQSTRVAGDFWLGKPRLQDLYGLYRTFIVGSTRLPYEILAFGLSILLLVFRGTKGRKDTALLLWLFLPAITTYVLSFVSRPLFFDRYLILSVPPLVLLLASSTRVLLPIKRATQKIFMTDLLLVALFTCLFFIDWHTFTHPGKQPFRDVAKHIHATFGTDTEVINYYVNYLHYFELKYYGVNVKIYSPYTELPFWTGRALVDPQDILSVLPERNPLYIMASGDIERVAVPQYVETEREQFSNLYLFTFTKQ